MALIQDKIKELVTPTIEGLGFTVWGVEFLNARVSTLRIYIDSDSEAGVGIEDCSTVSRAISSLLDVENPIEQEYNLEISSPGFYRPLFTLEQYSKYIGENIKVQLRLPQQNSRKWFGQLVEVKNNSIVIDSSIIKPKKSKPNNKSKIKNLNNLKAKSNTSTSNDEPALIEVIFTNISKANLEPDFN